MDGCAGRFNFAGAVRQSTFVPWLFVWLSDGVKRGDISAGAAQSPIYLATRPTEEQRNVPIVIVSRDFLVPESP